MVLFAFYFFCLSPQANRWHSVKIDCLLILIWINFSKRHSRRKWQPTWRRKWPSTPVFLPGEFHEQRSLAGYSPWGCKESDTTEWLTHRHWVRFQILTKPRKFKDEFGCTFPLVMHVFMPSCSVLSDSLQPHGVYPAWLLCPWDSPGTYTWVGCHALLQGISSPQGLNSCLLHCSQILYHQSHQGIPWWYPSLMRKTKMLWENFNTLSQGPWKINAQGGNYRERLPHQIRCIREERSPEEDTQLHLER